MYERYFQGALVGGTLEERIDAMIRSKREGTGEMWIGQLHEIEPKRLFELGKRP